MKQHNIAFIVQGGKGGTLEYIKTFLKNINTSKFKITTICHGEFYDELTQLGYNTQYIEMCREISLKNDLTSLIQIIKYLKNNKVDLAYCHSSKAGVLGRVASMLCRIPNIYNPHGWSFSMRVSEKKKKIFALIEKMMSFITDKIVLISEAEYNNALQMKIAKPSKFIVINNGIDIKKFNSNNNQLSLKKELKIKDDDKIIGMVGRLTEQKNPEMFVDIAKKLVEKYNSCKFILIGDGELKDSVINKINELKLTDYFILPGWIKNIEDYVGIMDIPILTSKWEGFGLVLAEYMACKKPVVASSVDGIPFVVRDGIDGFLCNPDNADEFVDHIYKLLTDEELYNKMAMSGYARACEKFSIDRVVLQHEELFKELINNK